MGEVVVCVDVGSTYTKAALVDVADGRLVATAEHPTTVASDVLDGLDACVARLAEVDRRSGSARVLACSSAGGGLRIAVVGNEELVTAEAGRRVALSSGGRVVHVTSAGDRTAGTADAGLGDQLRQLADARPDVVLLVGGTDGGDSEMLLRCARLLSGWKGPVVVAGNAEAQDEVAAVLARGGTPHVVTDNVMPRIGVLAPGPARSAIRGMFLSHVIGGKHLSRGTRFEEIVRGPTPDLVLTAVELLAAGEDADGTGRDVVVVDVGGATTDVYSAVAPVDDDESGLSREVVATTPANRTVEGDLGLRWSARSTVEAAAAAGLVPDSQAEPARTRAAALQAHPGFVPSTPADRAFDRSLASWAVTVALQRHSGRASTDRTGIDLRAVAVLVGSGGALRHDAHAVTTLRAYREAPVGWLVPEDPRVLVDSDYVLAPAGLLAAEHPGAARGLLDRLGLWKA